MRYRREGRPAWAAPILTETGLKATIEGLQADTTYQVQVRAVNDEGEGPWSDTGTGSTGPASNVPPTITPPGSKSYLQGETITPFAIEVTDAEDTPSVTVTGLPSGLGYSSGTVSGTVAADAPARDYTVTITADDGMNAAVTLTFIVTVRENAPPAITNPGSKSYLQGETITPFDIEVTDAEDSPSVTVTGLPSGLGYSSDTVGGTVAANAAVRDYTVTITAVDGVNAAVTVTFTVTVMENTPPSIANPGGKSYLQGEAIMPFAIEVTDAEDSPSVSVTGLPSGLGYSSGTVSGTVVANAPARDYTVTITADDGVNTAVTLTFTVTVRKNTPSAITNPGSKSYLQGETITPFAIEVTDAEDTPSVTVTGLPDGLSYSSGTVSGTLAADATVRDYAVTITADDGVNAAVTLTFTVTVRENVPLKPEDPKNRGGGGGPNDPPSQPEDQNTPRQPSDPENPDDGSNSNEQPGQPEDQNTPRQPSDPENPDDGSNSNEQPGQPEDHNTPQKTPSPENRDDGSNSNEQPGQPEDQNTPRQPSDPENPDDGSNSNEPPGQPEDQNTPRQPSDPENRDDGSNSNEPPGQPEDQNTPRQPSDPENPDDGSNSNEQPGQPEDQSTPRQPSDPENPDDGGNSNEQPGQPEDQSTPRKPSDPENPDDGSNSNEQPGQPEDQSTPRQPSDPENPGDGGNSNEQPGQPEDQSAPGKPSNAAKRGDGGESNELPGRSENENAAPAITDPGDRSHLQGETITLFDIEVTDAEDAADVTVPVSENTARKLSTSQNRDDAVESIYCHEAYRRRGHALRRYHRGAVQPRLIAPKARARLRRMARSYIPTRRSKASSPVRTAIPRDPRPNRKVHGAQAAGGQLIQKPLAPGLRVGD